MNIPGQILIENPQKFSQEKIKRKKTRKLGENDHLFPIDSHEFSLENKRKFQSFSFKISKDYLLFYYTSSLN
jgi:hypothetical protein